MRNDFLCCITLLDTPSALPILAASLSMNLFLHKCASAIKNIINRTHNKDTKSKHTQQLATEKGHFQFVSLPRILPALRVCSLVELSTDVLESATLQKRSPLACFDVEIFHFWVADMVVACHLHDHQLRISLD
jgi:hypothetical protein